MDLHSLMHSTEPIQFLYLILVDLVWPSILLTMQFYLLAFATRLRCVQYTKIAAWYTLMSICSSNECTAFFKEKRKWKKTVPPFWEELCFVKGFTISLCINSYHLFFFFFVYLTNFAIDIIILAFFWLVVS